MAETDDPLKWVRRGIALFMLVVGWVFIAWQNRFHVTAPMVFVELGYLAVVASIYNLWRTGAAAVAPDAALDAWQPPLGERAELEKEKRTLLKAIKEAEFDHQMGKLSKADADEMIATYKVRAIEVLKLLEKTDDKASTDIYGRVVDKESVREKIAREVKARMAVAKGAKAQSKQDKARADAKAEARKAKASAKGKAKEASS